MLRSLVPVICPAQAQPLADAIVDHVELTIAATAPLVRRGFAAGLVAYDLGALPRYFRRAHALTGARAERYFQSWEHGPTRLHAELARAMNQLVSLACYEQPAMMEAVGYRVGPWIEEVRAKRLRVFADDIAKQDRQILAPDPLRPDFTGSASRPPATPSPRQVA
ncbi:MAG TPA: hypothetical protein VGF94_10210 [Kofleriaceae bacterium]